MNFLYMNINYKDIKKAYTNIMLENLKKLTSDNKIKIQHNIKTKTIFISPQKDTNLKERDLDKIKFNFRECQIVTYYIEEEKISHTYECIGINESLVYCH